MSLQVACVRDRLFLGSQDVAADWSLLKNHGITHVLNVASGIPCFFPTEFEYKMLEILDLPEFRLESVFDACFQFIDAAIRHDGKVLIHCNAGISRSVAIIIAFLMRSEGMTYVEAFQMVKCKRSAIRPNPGFVQQLLEFERSLAISKAL